MSDELVSKVAVLDDFIEATGKIEGYHLTDLWDNRVLAVNTQNSTYTIHILNTFTREVVISGGKYFLQPEHCILSGSSIPGGSFLKIGWIGIGMCLEIYSKSKGRIVTSPVKSVSFGGQESGAVN